MYTFTFDVGLQTKEKLYTTPMNESKHLQNKTLYQMKYVLMYLCILYKKREQYN